MIASVNNIQNYKGYTKCGEILRPPSGSYQLPYVLKCFVCSEIYLLYDSFIYHVEDHCKKPVTYPANNDSISESTEAHYSQHHVEFGAKIDFSIKVEENKSMTSDDPLIDLKREYLSDVDDSASLSEVELKSQFKNTNEKNLTINDTCESDSSLENLDNKGEPETVTSEEEIESSSDVATDDDDYEVQCNKQSVTFKQSAPANDFFKTKEYITSLIQAYKNQPSLWNKNLPFLRHKSIRQNCYQEIANELKKQHNLSIKWNQVASAIVFLCRKYREDLKNLRDSKGEGSYIPSWFFQNLNFLKPFMENNKLAKLDSHLPDLSRQQIIEILDIYKSLPHLWNTEIIEHYCKNKIEAARREMLQLLDTKMGIKISEFILEEYFRTVNNYFARAKRKKTDTTKSHKTDSDANNEDYYEYLIFLTDHIGIFNCTECKRSFKSPMYLKIHQTQAHGYEPLPCSMCQKKFRSVSAYRNHAKRHMKDLNHECKECGKKFLQANELGIHMRNHTGVKPFCCEICGASFRHIQSFSSHHRRHIKKYLHTCETCGKGFYTKDRYKDHMNSHTNTRNQVCKVCGKTFITKRTLRQHSVIHEDIRRYACRVCGKAFKHKTGVIQHMRTHGVTSKEEKTT